MSVIQLIASSSPFLRRIDLTDCRLITNLTVQVIAQLCSQLEELSLQGCGLITDEAIEQVAYHCSRLTKIDLGRCIRVSDRALLALLRNSGRMTTMDPVNTRERTRSAKLTHLGIAGCHGVTLTGLLAIEKGLSFTPSTGDRSENAIELDDSELESESSLLSLEFTCPALKRLSNRTLSQGTMTTMATPANLSQASRFFQTLPRSLEEITIHDAYTLSHNDVICLVDKVGPNLKILRFDNANAISPDTLAHVLTMCPNLTVLCIPRATRLDDTGVIQLKTARCAQSLVELDLSACHALTDACLTSLALSDPSDQPSRTSSSLLERGSKGKSVCEREQVGRFPNLRRLDLSYNDKLTLSGIIPLVMSLKKLCALDVSFCGEGVTRSWSSSLESLRLVLNPAAVDASQSSLEQESSFNSSHSPGATNMSENGYREGSSSSQPPTSPTTAASSSIVQHATSHGMQQLTSGVNSMIISGRRGLGGYVGPWLNRSAHTSPSSGPVPHHPHQSLGQGTLAQESQYQLHDDQTQTRGGSSAFSSSTSSPSANGPRDQCHSHYSCCSCNCSISSSTHFSSRTILADRLDVLEYTPRRIGMQARFYQESWFTPQHQNQLQQLFHIQLHRQRDMQDQLAAMGAGQGNVLGFSLVDNGAGLASLPLEMMNHPVMVAARAGVATLPLNGGQGLGLPGEQHPQWHHRQHQHQHQLPHQQYPVTEMMDMNDNSHRNLDHRQPVGGRAMLVMARRHHHRHHQHRRGSLSHGSGVIGHCEISAWGLSKLREEWAMT